MKSNKGLLGLVIFLAIGLIGTSAYIVYDKYDVEEKNVPNKEIVNDKEVVNNNADIDEIGKYIFKTKFNTKNEEILKGECNNFFDYFLFNKNIGEIENLYKLYLTMEKLFYDRGGYPYDDTFEINRYDFENVYYSIWNDEEKIKYEDFNVDYDAFKCSLNDDKIICNRISDGGGCNGPAEGSIKYYKTEYKDNSFVVYIKILAYDFGVGPGRGPVYKDFLRKNQIGEYDYEKFSKNNFIHDEKLWEKAGVYKLKFKINNDHIIWESTDIID